MPTYPLKKLSEICDFMNGLWTGKEPPFVKVGVIRNTNFSRGGNLDYSDIAYLDVEEKQYGKRKLQYGDIILEKSGGGPKQPVGRVVIFDKKEGEFSFSNFTSVLRIKNSEEVYFQYLHRFLHHLYISGVTEKMQSHSTGIRNLVFSDYKELKIPLPPLSVQEEIVAKLDAALASIDEAKTKTQQALSATRELWESTLEEAFRGDDWEEKRFDEVCVLQRGFDLPTHARNMGKFPLVSSNGITDRIDLWKVKAPGVVTGRSGTIGNIHFVEEDFWPLNTSLYIKNFHGNNEKCIYYFLKQFNLGRYSSGAGVPTLNRNNVHCEMVRFPPISEQSRIVAHLDVVRAETDRLASLYEQKLADLDELRRSVLQEVFAQGA